MKVSERYDIDEDELHDRASEGEDYWENAYRFYMRRKDKDVTEISEKETFWLEKIERQLEK